MRSYLSELPRGRGVYARVARQFHHADGRPYTAEHIRQVVRKYADRPREPVHYVNLTPPPVANWQVDPLLVRLILAPERTQPRARRDIIHSEMRRCVLMVLYATMITVLCSVVLPPAALVVVPSWGLLIRELNTALNWERAR